jgi:hypothetical protein
LLQDGGSFTARRRSMNQQWKPEDPVIVVVDGATLPDPDDGVALTAVTLRMPAYFAEHLAQILTAWTQVSELATALPAGEAPVAEALLDAACVARRRDDASLGLLQRRMRDLVAEYLIAVRAQQPDGEERNGQPG